LLKTQNLQKTDQLAVAEKLLDFLQYLLHLAQAMA